MKHRVEVIKHTPLELSPHGYIRFQIRDEETEETIGTLEVRKDRIRWCPADKQHWLEQTWEQLSRQWSEVGST